jgi:hypothetical protein
VRGLIFACSGTALLLTLACGGGGGGAAAAPASSPTLSYTNPATAPADWQLVKDSTSTASRVVLDLMAPTETTGQGITLILTVDTSRAAWAAFSSGSYVSGLQYDNLLVNKASLDGAALRIVAAQTGAVSYGSAPVLQVALDLGSGASSGGVSLTGTSEYHTGQGALSATAISIDLGTLSVQ